MNVLVIGGTGNFGKLIIKNLILSPATEQIISISKSKKGNFPSRVIQYLGDSNDDNFLCSVFEGHKFDVVIHIPNILLADLKVLLANCEKHLVKHLIVIGSAAMFTKLDAPTRELRIEQENLISKSKVNWTILRPNMVYGHKNDQNIYKLFTFLKNQFLLPVPGSPDVLQNPTHIEDFVGAVISSMLNERSYKKCYNLVGAQPISLRGMVGVLSPNKRVFVVSIPLKISVLALKVLRFFKLAEWHPEKLLRLNEEKVLKSTPESLEDLGYSPRNFEEGVKAYFED
ncbi:hypothetical protein E4S40_00740 [Algoriphagus kandeliae]|uniref:NAD-dependent epimerase/dehydratase family protein n=1 Tax=Algoriphagus kandeliae TaxID=2562278 RepID=A0A4Y9R208_9BACT|nr:hypothetical protein [Algoriphagus kandeliae]TFV97215.1 hypothetical protein E4S40_00740 [Algoriphagus kandeliae]